MNKQNVKVTFKDDFYIAEWADRSLDDEDRYKEDDTIFLWASGQTEKEMWTNLAYVYDRWIDDTRR